MQCISSHRNDWKYRSYYMHPFVAWVVPTPVACPRSGHARRGQGMDPRVPALVLLAVAAGVDAGWVTDGGFG